MKFGYFLGKNPRWPPFPWQQGCQKIFLDKNAKFGHIQSNLDTTYLGITYFLLLHTFLLSPVFSPSLSLLIYPQYNVHFTTYNLLQRSFSGRPKFVFSYMFQPRYNVYRKTAISCQIWSKNHSRDQPHI